LRLTRRGAAGAFGVSAAGAPFSFGSSAFAGVR